MLLDSLTTCLLKSRILSSRDFWGNSGRFFCDDRVMIVLMIKSTFGALEAQLFGLQNGLVLDVCFGCVFSEAIFGSGTWEIWADTLVPRHRTRSIVFT